MKKVITYEAPDVTVFKIHPEGALCVSNFGEVGKAGNSVETDSCEEDF